MYELSFGSPVISAMCKACSLRVPSPFFYFVIRLYAFGVYTLYTCLNFMCKRIDFFKTEIGSNPYLIFLSFTTFF